MGNPNTGYQAESVEYRLSYVQQLNFGNGSSNRNTGDYRYVHGYCREDEIQYPQNNHPRRKRIADRADESQMNHNKKIRRM